MPAVSKYLNTFDIMWQSEDDVLKDIASLNDFGTSEDKESYKILYSVGRGLKAKEKPKISEKFIDSRTGEAVNLEDAILDTSSLCYKSKGRGSLLGSFFRTKLQLQQQLRLARPLGSGDEAIESYYGRCRSPENIKSSINTSDSKLFVQNPRITSESYNPDFNSVKIKKRIKATRNSSIQVNALITSLLSKHKIDSDATMKQNFMSDIKDEQLLSNSNNAEKCDGSDIIDNVQKSALSDLNFSNLTLSRKWNKKPLDKNVDYFKESTIRILHEEHVGDENFKIIDNDEKEEEQLKKKETKKHDENLKKIKNGLGLTIIGCRNTEPKNDRDVKYRALGERLNKLKQSRSNITRNGRYDSASFSEYSASTESVVFIDEEFPPLRKS